MISRLRDRNKEMLEAVVLNLILLFLFLSYLIHSLRQMMILVCHGSLRGHMAQGMINWFLVILCMAGY